VGSWVNFFLLHLKYGDTAMVYWRPGINVDNAAASHIRLIHKGVKRWNQWRKVNRTERVDLAGADFSKLNLAGINFMGVNLSAANFHKANLEGAYFRFANLSGTNLSGTNLSDADLNSAILMKASLSTANLQKADLCRADLTEADLTEVDGEQAFWVEAKLGHATLVSANFSKGIFTEANMEWANLSDANLSKADLSFANLSHANLTQANLNRVIFIEGRLIGAVLDKASFYFANCYRTTFEGASLQAANLESGNFCEANFVGANLSDVNLKEAKTNNANFKAARLYPVQDIQQDDSRLALPNGRKPETAQWLLPATDFTEGLDTLSSPFSSVDPGLTVTPRRLQNAWEQERSPSIPLSSVPPTFSPSSSPPSTWVELSFPGAIDWIALAMALRQMNQMGTFPPLHLMSIETLPGAGIMVRLEMVSTPGDSEVKGQLMQHYENLCTILAQTFRQPLGLPELPYRRRVSDSRLGSLTQLFDLLTAHFL
jgi:uncharacterized protein YjbI with pentapeptide repeats